MYADKVTGSMRRAIDETERRRAAQDAYNRANGITPKTIVKEIRDPIEVTLRTTRRLWPTPKSCQRKKKKQLVEKLTAEMKRAAKELDFETAAALRRPHPPADVSRRRIPGRRRAGFKPFSAF